MPDENKFQKLRQIGYKIPDLCVTCKFSRFHDKLWGVCVKHQYSHEKHTGDQRKVSIVKFGSCGDHVENPLMVIRLALGAHEEFLSGRGPTDLPSTGKIQ